MRFRDKVSRAAVTFLSDWKNMYILYDSVIYFGPKKKFFNFVYILLLLLNITNHNGYFFPNQKFPG